MRSRTWTALIMVVPLTFLLWGYLQMYQRNAAYAVVADRLSDERASARRAGLALSPEQMEESPAVPEPKNAAPIYSSISDDMDKMLPAPWDDLRPVNLGQASDTDRKKARALLTRYAPVMARAEAASLLPDCRFHRDWRQGGAALYSEHDACRQLVRLFVARASLACDAGMPVDALKSVLVGARIACQIGQEPSVSSVVTRAQYEVILDRPLVRTLLRYSDRPGVLELADQIEAVLKMPYDLSNALRGECLLRLMTMEGIRKYDPRARINGYPPPFPPHASHAVVMDAWETRCLSYWRRTMIAVAKAQGDPIDVYRAIKSVSDTERADLMGPRRRFNATYEMSGQLETDFSDVALRLVTIESQHSLRQTVIRLLRYRLKTGSFPADLHALGTPETVDPFAHQELRYRPDQNGFVVYSVGVNLADDGGDGKAGGRGNDPPDIVIAYPPKSVPAGVAQDEYPTRRTIGISPSRPMPGVGGPTARGLVQ